MRPARRGRLLFAHIAVVRDLLHLARPAGSTPLTPGGNEAFMFSLFGWTPSLRRMLRGRILPCGCSVGVYETRSGEVVQIVDARAPDCAAAAHSVDAVVAAEDMAEEEPDPVPAYTHTTVH